MMDEIRKRYPKAGDAELRDEIWSALRERNSPAMERAIKTLQGKVWYNRAWAAFKDAWKGILSRMGFNRADLSKIDKMSNDEFLDFLDKTMAEGKTLGRLEKGGGGTRNAVRKEEYDRWNKLLDAYERGELKPESQMTVFEHTPVVLRKLGSPDRPVTLGKDVLDKIVGIVKTESGGKHDIPVSELRDLQIELDNPIAVFDSKTQPNAKVVLTRIVDRQNNERAVVALHLDREHETIRVNKIASAYGKDPAKMERWVRDGLLRYVNKQARDSMPVWVQFPPDSELRARSILTEEDFSNEELGRIVADSAADGKGVSEENPSTVREARAPKPAGYKIMDDVQTKVEKAKEKLVDRYASVQSVQDDVGGVKEIVGPDGYTDHTKSTDFVAAADKANGRIEYETRELGHRSAEIDKDLAEAGFVGDGPHDRLNNQRSVWSGHKMKG